MARPRKPAPPAIAEAARDAKRQQETVTSGLTPDQRTVMKPQETGTRTLRDAKEEAARWPFPAPRGD